MTPFDPVGIHGENPIFCCRFCGPESQLFQSKSAATPHAAGWKKTRNGGGPFCWFLILPYFLYHVDMSHLNQEGGRDSDRWYIYIHMIFIYGLSCVLFVWYFWVTCPSDFFLGSEGPKAAASAGSLVTLRDASLSPPTDVYNWKGSTHKHTQSCWRFKSQGIQHSTNIGLAWCSANSFLSIQPCCSNPWACHSTSARFCNNKKLAAAEANQVHFLISNPYY